MNDLDLGIATWYIYRLLFVVYPLNRCDIINFLNEIVGNKKILPGVSHIYI